MRPIDADKLHPDRMTNKGTVAISQSQIANAETIRAIPVSTVEEIKDKILNCEINISVYDEQYEEWDVKKTTIKECLDAYADEGSRAITKIIDEEVKKALKAPESIRAYPCDSKKNTDCKKTGCYERGGPCKLTLNPEYAKEETCES